MRKYLLLALTLSIGMLVVFTQNLPMGAPQSGNSSTTDVEGDSSLALIGPSPTVTATVTMMPSETPTVTATPTQPKSYLPLIFKQPTQTPTNTPTNTPTATNTPTVTPTPTPAYPRSPWLLQSGGTTYQYNPSLYWIQGSIKWPDGERILGFHVQVCYANGSACSGPSGGSREEHNGIQGYYDWVAFNGQLSSHGGDGDYYAVVADCSDAGGDPHNATIGTWPACEEHSERVYFEIDRDDRAVVNVDWVLVDPTRD